jgi:hypothetical protein
VTVAVVRAVLVLALLIGSTGRVTGQSASAPTLQAAFLFNFAKFIQWPSETLPAGAPLVFCVANDEQVAKSLEASRLTIEGHMPVVRRVVSDSIVGPCHIVYVSDEATAREFDQVLQALSGRPSLTVSDDPTFAQRGGMVSFFVEGSRLRFAINVQTAERARLQISSKLLSLAKLVKNDDQ